MREQYFILKKKKFSFGICCINDYICSIKPKSIEYMSNFMKVSQNRRKHPPFVSGRLAFSFALGLMAFAPSSVLANVDANTSMSVQQQKLLSLCCSGYGVED